MSFVPAGLGLGMLTVVNTYVSQNLGAGRPERCGQYTWAGIVVAVAISLAIMPLAIAAGKIFSLFPHTAEVRALETMYFRYMIVGLILFLTARAMGQFFFGIHKPGVVLIASLISNVFNVGANYVT